MEVGGQLHAPAALPLQKSCRYPLNGMLSGSQNWNGRSGEEMNLLSMATTKPRFFGYPTRGLIMIPTELFRLLGFRWLTVGEEIMYELVQYVGAWLLLVYITTCCRRCLTAFRSNGARSYDRGYTPYKHCWNNITLVVGTVMSEHIIGSSLQRWYYSFC
jgi:hypothetical protein